MTIRRNKLLFLISLATLTACGGPSISMQQPSHNLLLVEDEQIHLTFEDASKVVGQPCSCAAAGFAISRLGLEVLGGEMLPVRGELRLVASREHAVTDVVTYILGIERRSERSETGFLLDPNLSDDPGIWKYIILDPERTRAVEVTYFKWRLMEDPVRHRLHAIEERSESGQATASEREEFRSQMSEWSSLLLDPQESRAYIETQTLDFGQLEATYPELTYHHHH